MDYSCVENEFREVLYWKPRGNGIFGRILFFLLLAGGLFTFLKIQPILLSQNSALPVYGKIEEASKSSVKDSITLPTLNQDKDKRTNILLIGMAGKPWPSPYLTDSLQIVSASSDFQDISAIAVPRDLLVKISGSKKEARINSLYSISKDPSLLIKKLKEITGLKIQYYIVIDLKTLEKVVNIFGGVDVNVKEKIYDPAFPTVSRGYEAFSINAGGQHLDGATAIKYIRSRHQARGDFGRVERQQQVMEVLQMKVIKLKLFSDFKEITALFREFKGKTNFTLKDLRILTGLAKSTKDREIKYLLIDAGKPNSLLLYGETYLGGKKASVLWPKAGKFNYAGIKAKINSLLK
ncbi:MAG: LCP family protein [Patescibacteria group bacterium]